MSIVGVAPALMTGDGMPAASSASAAASSDVISSSPAAADSAGSIAVPTVREHADDVEAGLASGDRDPGGLRGRRDAGAMHARIDLDEHAELPRQAGDGAGELPGTLDRVDAHAQLRRPRQSARNRSTLGPSIQTG